MLWACLCLYKSKGSAVFPGKEPVKRIDSRTCSQKLLLCSSPSRWAAQGSSPSSLWTLKTIPQKPPSKKSSSVQLTPLARVSDRVCLFVTYYN